MGYRVREYIDYIQVFDTVIDHPLLGISTPWYRNGVYQGETTIGLRGFLVSENRRECIIFDPEDT
jgi:hypothetical protein